MLWKLFVLLSLIATVFARPLARAPSDKKGIGMGTTAGWGQTQLDALNVSWYYSWAYYGIKNVTTKFVPMIKGLDNVKNNIPAGSQVVLGFNEPDINNISASDALAVWNSVTSKAPLVVAPVMAGNPTNNDSWLLQFAGGKPKMDYVALHWYKGTSASTFKSDVIALYNLFKVPVWVTEFAPQTSASSSSSPTKYTVSSIVSFVQNVVPWMESQSWIVKYAWHDPKVIGSSCSLYNADGTLTAVGLAYASA